MSFNHPFLNALLAAVVGVLLVVMWSWQNETNHKYTLMFVGVGCAILGYQFGEPFVKFLMHSL